jgi:hypothetical protein
VPRLRDLYVHISSNTPEFEFFCLARWLVMAEFARRQGLREFLYLDSDVLLYEAPVSIAARIPPCRIALSWYGDLDPAGDVACPAVTLIRDAGVLAEIIEDIFSFYRDRPQLESVREALSETVRQHRGGISDMWFLARAIRSRSLPAFNLGYPVQDGAVDFNMFQANGFRCREGLKEIVFRDRRPYGFCEADSRWIRFATLHFGGHTKRKIANYLGRPFSPCLIKTILSERIRKWLGGHRASDLFFCHYEKTLRK